MQRREGWFSCSWCRVRQSDLSPGGPGTPPNPILASKPHRVPLSLYRVTQLSTRRQAPGAPATPQGSQAGGDPFLSWLKWAPGVEAKSGASPGPHPHQRAPGGRDACWVRTCRVTAVPSPGPCSSSCRNSRLWSPTRSPDLTRWQPPRLGPASW